MMPDGIVQLEWAVANEKINKHRAFLQDEIHEHCTLEPDGWLLFLGFCNTKKLLVYFSLQDENRFRQEYINWIDVELKNNVAARNPLWSESIAVDSEPFITDIKEKLANRARKCSARSANGITVLKEPRIPYNALFGGQKVSLSQKNTYFW